MREITKIRKAAPSGTFSAVPPCMITSVKIAVLLALLVLGVGTSHAAPIFYVNNPSANSIDWTTTVTGLGGAVNSNVNFNAHSVGPLNNAFYAGSDGVTFSTSGPITQVQFGAGPAQGNTSGQQPGEGTHLASNFLFGGASLKTLTISFATPVLGAGFFTLDYFDTNPNDRMEIRAYDGANATGTLLGSALSVNQNFQQNRLYFMGVSDSANVIRSIQFSYSGAGTGDTMGIDDIRFATGAIPQPAALLLVALGLTLGVLRRTTNQIN